MRSGKIKIHSFKRVGQKHVGSSELMFSCDDYIGGLVIVFNWVYLCVLGTWYSRVQEHFWQRRQDQLGTTEFILTILLNTWSSQQLKGKSVHPYLSKGPIGLHLIKHIFNKMLCILRWESLKIFCSGFLNMNWMRCHVNYGFEARDASGWKEQRHGK